MKFYWRKVYGLGAALNLTDALDFETVSLNGEGSEEVVMVRILSLKVYLGPLLITKSFIWKRK